MALDGLLTSMDGDSAGFQPGPVRSGDALLALRRIPLATTRLTGASPAWSTGLAVERRYGPITDSLGRDFWIDVFRRVRQVRFVRSPGAPPFLTLPLTQAGLLLNTARHGAGQPLALSAGSLWFATGLVSAAPANVYTGVRIKGGSLRFSADIALGGDEILVPASVSVELALELDPPAATAAAGSTLAATRVQPPEGLDIAIRPAGASIAVRGEARLTAWGAEILLKPSADAAEYRADLNGLVLPMKPEPKAFEVVDNASKLFEPNGSAPIAAAGLALPAALIAPADLATASGVGALMLSLDGGLSAHWHTQPRVAALGTSLLMLDTSRLALTAQAVRAAGDTVRPALAAALPPGAVSWSWLDRTAVHYFAMADGSEAVAFSAAADLRLPKPVDVGGNRVGARLPAAIMIVNTTAEGAFGLQLFGLAASNPADRGIAFALTNAILRVTRPVGVLLAARFEGNTLVEGQALTVHGLSGLLPSLPDPYAANTNLDRRFGVRNQGNLSSRYRFGAAGDEVGFVLPPGVQVDAPVPSSDFASGLNITGTATSAHAADSRHDRGDLFDFEGQPRIVLLDVSSNASRFGVALRPPRREDAAQASAIALKPPQVTALDLAVDGRMLVLLTLPAVQWEPVRAEPGFEPFPDEVRFANSGVPTILDVPSVELVPVNPLAAYRTILDNFAGPGPLPSRARFTLPFGMLAHARLTPASLSFSGATLGEVHFRGATLGEVRPNTVDLQGAHQLRIEAVDLSLAQGELPALPGFTAQLPNAIPGDGSPATSILGTNVSTIFNGFLGAGQPTALVPVTRIDLSGHGETLFSAWANPEDPETGVTTAEFQVLNGRAAYEVVQVKATKCPYFVPVVRTITLERKGNAVFTRRDSGWVPVRDGEYRANPGSGIVNHPGVVLRATRVTNIRETGMPFLAGGVMFVAVYFDADLIIDGAPAPVPAERQLGYVKLSIPELDSSGLCRAHRAGRADGRTDRYHHRDRWRAPANAAASSGRRRRGTRVRHGRLGQLGVPRRRRLVGP